MRKWGKTAEFVRDVAVKHESDECLLWPFAAAANGYGMVWSEGRVQPAHRVVCQAVHGRPKHTSLQAAHSCGNRLCCNPRHLRWASRQENEADKLRHGTHVYGERHVAHKLTEAQVLEIRSIGRTVAAREHAERFGVSEGVIWRIINRRSWPYAGSAV